MDLIAIEKELIAGGLEESLLNIDVNKGSNKITGDYDGGKIEICISSDYSYAVIGLEKVSVELITAFESLIEGRPVFRYKGKGFTVLEWHKNGVQRRYSVLKKERTNGLRKV